jgi:ATP-dependent RNA helicase DbpA
MHSTTSMALSTHGADSPAPDLALRARLPVALQQALHTLNYTTLTPIQCAALPPMLDGHDVRAQAKTGSGKTAAFGLALLARLTLERIALQGLVLCPTRELADQLAGELRRLGAGMPNLKILTIYGGVARGPQLASLSKHAPHVIVGTPGRVLDHLEKGHLALDTLAMLVLDEADRLLDMGFSDTMNRLIERMPQARLTWLFSATFPETVDRLSQRVQRNPLRVEAQLSHADSAIKQHFYAVAEADKPRAVRELLKHYQAESVLIFCNTKQDLADLAHDLTNARIPVLALHGDLEQRDRAEVLLRFNNGSARVLLATDVAARGLDVKFLSLVISYELAFEPEMHTHRIGRTGRAGETGLALHLVAPREAERLRKLDATLEPMPTFAALPVSLAQPPLTPALMQTLVIDGGKTDKLRAGDVLGALTGVGGLHKDMIGKIDVTPTRTYVAIVKTQLESALNKLKAGGTSAKIKGRNFRVRLL